MLSWLKKLFPGKPKAIVEITEEKKMLEKPCKGCGKPIFYDPTWDHIPNYCRECKQKYRNEHEITRIQQKQYPDVDDSYYLDGSEQGYKNAFEEYSVRIVTEKVMMQEKLPDLRTFLEQLANT